VDGILFDMGVDVQGDVRTLCRQVEIGGKRDLNPVADTAHVENDGFRRFVGQPACE
jgi:hypothetical protein